MKRKGMSHIEVIFAFVLFFGFLAFALYFFSPINNNRVVDTTINYAFRELVDNVSVRLDTFSVKINDGVISGDVVAIDIPERSGVKTRVEDSTGNVLDSKRVGYLVMIKSDVGSWGASPIDFVYIHICEEFVDDAVSDVILEELYYSLASSESREIISEKRILELNETYYSDYSGLKEEFNIQNRADIGFSLRFSDSDSVVAERKVASSLDVFADSRRVQVLREDGSFQFGDIGVKVW